MATINGKRLFYSLSAPARFGDSIEFLIPIDGVTGGVQAVIRIEKLTPTDDKVFEIYKDERGRIAATLRLEKKGGTGALDRSVPFLTVNNIEVNVMLTYTSVLTPNDLIFALTLSFIEGGSNA